jgi:hypothetical protein
MSETTTVTNEPTNNTDPDEGRRTPDATPPDDNDDDGARNPNAEAARYRTRLRETEAERDALTAAVTSLQRRECERHIAEALECPADLWDIAAADPAAFYNDDGTLDETRLADAVAELLKQRPRLAAKRQPRQWGQHSGTTASPYGWADVINGG